MHSSFCMLLSGWGAARPGARASLLFKVYPAERDTGDAGEVGGKLRADMEKLPHPLRPGDANVQHVFRVQMQDFAAASQRGAAGHRPRGGQAIFRCQIAETARE